MIWNVVLLPEAKQDLKRLDNNQALLVRKAIKKVSQNPFPTTEGGYGHALSNKQGNHLAGCMKIKLRATGLRIVYKLQQVNDEMLIIVIGARTNDEIYDTAQTRLKKYNL